MAIGQGYVTATPLQMANLAATIANGGTRYRPHYVKRVDAPDGTVRESIQPEVMGEARLKKSTLDQVRSAMRDVVMTDERYRQEGARARHRRSPARRAPRRS